MSCKSREELVGKRFTSVRSDVKCKLSNISEWEWRSGFVRAVSTRDTSNVDFTVLVEFDDTGWKSREYLKVHDTFQEFLVEHTLSWVERVDPNYKHHKGPWPALCYKAIVDKAGVFQHSKRPVEFLSDRFLAFVDEKDVTYYKDGDENSVSTAKTCPDVIKWLKTWTDYQDGQKILLTTPTVLLGYRVEVYRTEGTTQWYTAVIKAYNHQNKSLTLTDDTVLEEHNEDPTLIQMHLIGDGVVDSILNGVDVGVAQRRRPRSTVTKQGSKDSSSISHATSRGVTNSNLNTGSQTKSNNANANNSTNNTQSPSTLSVGGGGGGSSSNSGSVGTPNRSGGKSRSSAANTPQSPTEGGSKDVSSVNCSGNSQQDSPAEPKGSGQSRSSKQAAKKKQDLNAKQNRKPSATRKLQKSASSETLEGETSVCKQTCNVLVKRIEENKKQQADNSEKPKPTQSRLRDKKPVDSPIKEEPKGSVKEVDPNDLTNSNIKPSSVDKRSDKIKQEAVKDSPPVSSPSRTKRGAAKSASPVATPTTNAKDSEPKISPNKDKDVLSSQSSTFTSPQSTKSTGLQQNVKADEIKPAKSLSQSIKVGKDDTSPKQKAAAPSIDKDSINDKPKKVSSNSPKKDKSVKKRDLGSDNPKNIAEEDMYYKKQILKAEGNISPHQPRQVVPPGPEDIDVTRSLTDQLAKRHRAGTSYPFNGDSKPGAEAIAVADVHQQSKRSLSPQHSLERDRIAESHPANLTKPRDFVSDRHSAFTSVHPASRPGLLSSAGKEDRADSRASDGQLPSHSIDDKRPGSQVDDIRSVRSSPGSSPFLVDRSEAVHPYRDPELMRKNPVQSNVQNIMETQQRQQKLVQPSPFPPSVVHNPVPSPSGGVPSAAPSAAAAFAGVSPLPARSLLSALPGSTLSYASGHHQLPPSISHLSLPHGYPLEAVVRAQQQHQLAALQQQQQLMNYSLGNPATRMTALDALWQRSKAPAPGSALASNPWLLQKGGESLMAGELALRDAHLQMQIEQERLELERREVERREIERERLEQERREKERKEMIERERLEKEKIEREKAAERERQQQIERERHQHQLERERQQLERERLERQQEWELHHKQSQLRATVSVDTEAAVDKHFQESLKGLTPQGRNMLSSMRGAGRGFIPKAEARHPFSPHSMPYMDKHHEQQRKDDKIKKEAEDDKRYLKGNPHDKGPMYPGYPYPASSGGHHPPTSAHQPQSQAVFSLYGYPTQPSWMTTEQLKQRGLLSADVKHPVKEEANIDKKVAYSSPPHHLSHPASPFHHKDHMQHNSVIVKREVKPKMEAPVAAHSHHNISPSSSSSPRLQHPRPAHTPEHWPERPGLSSSTSPVSGIPHHLMGSSRQHSSPGPPPSHSSVFQNAARSQSPYSKPPGSHLPQTMPLDYCKQPQQQHTDTKQHQNQYPHPASSQSSPSYSYNLIQQGLVPNPIYSQGGTLSQQQLGAGVKPSQHSPPGSKRKNNSKDNNSSAANRKKAKGQFDYQNPHQPLPIPVTTPQILTNPSPYTTTNSTVSLTRPGIGAMVQSSPSSHMPNSNSLSSVSAGSFQSFVNNTVNIAYLQEDQRKALEKSERERAAASGLKSAAHPGSSDVLDRKPDAHNSHHIPYPSIPTAATVSSSQTSSKSTISHRGSSSSSTTAVNSSSSTSSEAYNSRIMDTINRVATNQVDTDSDTLSACSPPPQISSHLHHLQHQATSKQSSSGTASPLNRSLNSSTGSTTSHPHHMKKAWLQRHDEDKKSETPPAVAPPSQQISSQQLEEDSSNSSLTQPKDIISCVENSSTILGVDKMANAPSLSGKDSNTNSTTAASPASVVVTLPNGNASDVNNHNESTSSASESEILSSSKSGVKKRAKSRKSGGSVKKSKPDNSVEEPSSATTPPPSNSGNSRKKTSATKRSKAEKETKTKDDSPMESRKKERSGYNSAKQSRDNSPAPSKTSNQQQQQDKVGSITSLTRNSAVPSPRADDRSIPSPALSESNMATMSPASSVSSSSSSNSSINTATMSKAGDACGNNKEVKDKKKIRKSKEISNLSNSTKDGKKSSSFNKPLVKMTVSTLKRTMVPFIQDGPCSEITPKLTKCRECKMTPVQRSKKQPNIFCRFYAFRRLKYNSRGVVMIDGFSELPDADPDDIEPWLPRYPVMHPKLDVENSKFIISKVGDKFCELVEQEREAKTWVEDDGKLPDVKIVWKRAVMGVREMCDVCDTTLFNMHWVCQKCGFVVCLDCYKVRIKEGKKPLTDDRWLSCSSNRQAHRASEMMLTQIVPSDALWELGRLIHEIRIKWSIPSNCPCGTNNSENNVADKNGINSILSSVKNRNNTPNGFSLEDLGNIKQSNKSKRQHQNDSDPLKNLDSFNPDTSSPLSILAEVASLEPDSSRDKMDGKRGRLDKAGLVQGEDSKKVGCSTLRELLTKYAGKPKVTNDKKAKKGSGQSSLDSIIQSVVEKRGQDGGAPFKFLHYTPRLGGGWKRELPIKIHNLTETSVLYPDVPHTWLCDGRLLRLHDAHHKGNLKIFQEQWKRGQPVLVSCANKKMDMSIWKPEIFSKEFGSQENEVVNCRTGDVIIGHCMSDFWDGFENLNARPVDENDSPMLLKLKDWPPGDDFSELLPSRFHDLMQALPLPEYTQRDGKLNLASRLPDFLVRPDLGPKMYNAYGSSQFPKEGTTNLHLDISDAVNVMVYVGVPGDGPGGRKAQEEAARRAIDDAGCDSITKKRVREVHEIPGALWHIYDAHDADKIRDFLNKVAKERGQIIETDHDAIHDQSWYLDKELCDRLLKEYGVQGYTIVQCHGDAIFIPAGAPHQVRNLHSCVKVAEDFVSPEHLNHCFRLTQEFRQLSETHTNHEDKLQVKNIIYHAVKDAVAVLRENDPDDE